MLSLINWKNYVILALVILCCIQTYRVKTVQLDSALLQNAIHTVNEQQTDKVRLKEQEAARRAMQSQTHTDEIMRAKVPGDCMKAIEWMITNHI